MQSLVNPVSYVNSASDVKRTCGPWGHAVTGQFIFRCEAHLGSWGHALQRHGAAGGDGSSSARGHHIACRHVLWSYPVSVIGFGLTCAALQ